MSFLAKFKAEVITLALVFAGIGVLVILGVTDTGQKDSDESRREDLIAELFPEPDPKTLGGIVFDYHVETDFDLSLSVWGSTTGTYPFLLFGICEDGEFRCDDIAEGTYSLVVIFGGIWICRLDDVVVRGGEVVRPPSLQNLKVGDGFVKVTFTAVDESGDPFPGIWIEHFEALSGKQECEMRAKVVLDNGRYTTYVPAEKKIEVVYYPAYEPDRSSYEKGRMIVDPKDSPFTLSPQKK